MFFTLSVHSEIEDKIKLSCLYKEGGILSIPILEVGDELYSDCDIYLSELYSDLVEGDITEKVSEICSFMCQKDLEPSRELLNEVREMLCYFKIKGVLK